jgi:hypothetical protein
MLFDALLSGVLLSGVLLFGVLLFGVLLNHHKAMDAPKALIRTPQIPSGIHVSTALTVLRGACTEDTRSNKPVLQVHIHHFQVCRVTTINWDLLIDLLWPRKFSTLECWRCTCIESSYACVWLAA